jgi:PAS domain S-box-containing protein
MSASRKPIKRKTTGGRVLKKVPGSGPSTKNRCNNRKKAEGSLQASETLYRTLVQNIPGMVYRAYPDRTADIISNAEALCGYVSDELNSMEHGWLDIIHPQDRATVVREGDPMVRTPCTMTHHYRIVTKDGQIKWVEDRKTSLFSASGRFLGIDGVVLDITERKRTEEALRQSERQYRQLTEQAADGVILLNTDGTFIFANSKMREMLGYSQEELYQLTIFDTYPADIRDVGRKRFASVQAGKSLRFERPMKRKDGTLFMVEINASRLADNRQQAIIRDITDRKRTEETLRANEQRLQEQFQELSQIYKYSPVGLSVLDCDLRYLRINERLAEMNGLPVDKHLGRTVHEVLPHLAETLEKLWKPLFETGKPLLDIEIQGRTPKEPQVTRHWLTSAIPLRSAAGDITSLVGAAIEITDLKRAEEQVNVSENKYRRLHAGMMDAFVCVDMAGRITEFNEVYRQMLGYERDELLSLTYRDLTPEKWHAMEAAIVAAQVLPRRFSDVYEKEYRRKDGTVFPVELRTILITDDSGSPIGMWAIIRDVTDRKQTEEALRQSEEQYRTLAETARDFIYIVDREDRVHFVNSFAAGRLGVRPQDLVGGTRSRLFSPAEASRQKRNLDRVFETGEMVVVESQAGFPGGALWLHTQLVPLRDADGTVAKVLGISRDVTSVRNSEEALRRSEEAHLDQMRRLARDAERLLEEERLRVSRHLHDGVGQSLTAHIMELASLEKRIRPIDPSLGDELQRARGQAGEMIDDVRNIAKSLRPIAIEHEGLIPAIRSYITEFQRLSGVKCRVMVRPADLVVREPSATAVFRILQEAMTNVARHAHASRCGIRLSASRDQLELRILDNGKGAPSDVLDGHESLGILGMKERASAVGGTLQVRNGAKAGVLVSASLPLDHGGTTAAS